MSAIFHQSLEQLLTRMISATQELRQILEDENNALIERDYERNQQITQAKQSKTDELEALKQQNIEIFAKAGFPYSSATFDTVISSADNAVKAKLAKLRSELENTTQECQEQNIINGRIIAVNQQATKTALAILRGQLNEEGDSLTYGASGQTVSNQSGTRITKA